MFGLGVQGGNEGFLGSILVLNMGLASMDLFYWSALARFAQKIRAGTVFGLGLGVSLFSLWAGGMLFERMVKATEPDIIRGMASLGLILLLVVILLFSRIRPQ